MAIGEPTEFKGLEDTASMPPDSRPTAIEPEPQRRIGPYRLVHVIGEGGMGEVWVADQLEPVKRRVALKVIKAGMDTKQVIARFEAERQALAMMNHPAIAKVLDAGATPEGRPYFVMEHVAGVSLTDHCDTHRLSTQDRLKLFIEVCEGVQHAHQKAIIHRDLKPSNILVSLGDGKAQPKIIDFGIAKATGQRLTDKTLATEIGSVIGTPEYMSPEQADLTGQDIDTRTDIYSLGVVLYQLLTGELPFGSDELRSSSYEELRRKLREVDPPRPSTKLATLREGAREAARRRDTDPGSLRKEIEGDLDAIVMKALEKDRGRRYGSASDLGADITRFLAHEPVVARPTGRLYRLGKYVQRHRLGVTFAATAVVLLVAFAAAMTIQTVRIARERDRANVERDWAMTWVRHATELAGVQRYADDPAYGRVLDSLVWRAQDYASAGDNASAEHLARDTLELAKRLAPKESFFTIWARNVLAEALIAQKQSDEAERVLRENIPLTPIVWPDALPMAGRTYVDLITLLASQGRSSEALSVLEQLFRGRVWPGIGPFMTKSKELAPLRNDTRFKVLLTKGLAITSEWCSLSCGDLTKQGAWPECLKKPSLVETPKWGSERDRCFARCEGWCR